MSGKMAKLTLLAGAFSLLVAQAMMTGAFAQGSGRPTVLVLPPQSELDRKVVTSFQWDLAKTLDKSGSFDIVKQSDFEKFLKENKLESERNFSDSAVVNRMMESLGANIYTVGSLKQAGGPGTQFSADVDFLFAGQEFRIDGQEVAVGNEKQTEDLAKQVAEPLLKASELISRQSIARSYFNSAIYDKAIENYKKVLELKPGDVEVFYMIATSHLKMNETEVALQEYEQILAQQDPKHEATRRILAQTYFSQEKFDQALTHYQTLAEQHPDDYGYTQYWAYTLVKLNRNEEALEVFRKLTGIKDEDPGIRMQMGYMQYTMMDAKDKAGEAEAAKPLSAAAVADFQRASELFQQQETPSPEDQKRHLDCMNLKALCLNKAGQKQAALQAYQAIVEKQPDYPNVYYFMGQLSSDLGRDLEAAKYYKEAVKTMPESSQWGIYHNIGSIYRKANDLGQAIEFFGKALPIAPADRKETVYLMRGLSYYDRGNELDYATQEDADLDALIEGGQMTKAKADQALQMYASAEQDLTRVNGKYAKTAQQHIQNIVILRERLDKIKKQIDYYEKTK